jgi:hypothetical protein
MNGQKVFYAQYMKKALENNVITTDGISLCNITHKIFAMLLYNRLSKIIEPEIGNYQMRFRPNISTVDNIFIVRHI